MKKVIIILCALCIFAFIFIEARGKVHAKQSVAEDQSSQSKVVMKQQEHELNVSLNQDYYQIECGEIFNISNVDITVNGTDPTILFENETAEKTYNQIGDHVEKIVVTDIYQDVKTVDITINAVDTTAPVLTGIWDCKVTQGGKFRPLYGVVAMDSVDGDVSNTLKCSEFNIDNAGVQTLIITATDKSGNQASTSFNLTVIEKAPPAFEIPIITNEVLSTIPTKYREVLPYDGLARSVSFWGDSLTQGYVADGTPTIVVDGITNATESSAFAKFSGLKVYNFGVWGELSNTIACRQGGLKMYVDDITIPAKGSVTFKHIMCEDGSEIYPLRYNNLASKASFDACSIGGVTGKLTYEYSTDSYVFTRAAEGPELVITENTQLISGNAQARKDDILILEMGNNGGWNQDYTTLINQYISMIEYSNCKYYLIIGDTDGSELESQRSDWDKALEEAFGDHFIRMREYLVENGLKDCGLTPTGADLDMIENKEVPISLKSDWSHLNPYGYYSRGKAIYERGVKLGYWK